jgi:hypothetical protein
VIYMGQIMAECDCPLGNRCELAGRCLAERKPNHRASMFAWMVLACIGALFVVMMVGALAS